MIEIGYRPLRVLQVVKTALMIPPGNLLFRYLLSYWRISETFCTSWLRKLDQSDVNVTQLE